MLAGAGLNPLLLPNRIGATCLGNSRHRLAPRRVHPTLQSDEQPLRDGDDSSSVDASLARNQQDPIRQVAGRASHTVTSASASASAYTSTFTLVLAVVLLDAQLFDRRGPLR